MNLLFKPKEQGKDALSDLKDPFKSDCVDTIWFHIRKGYFAPHNPEFSASVKFVNGNTKGEQSFDAPDFPTLVKKVEDFTKSLKK